jgi:hypothetical protein
MQSEGKQRMNVGNVAGEIVAERACIVYHPTTGEIVHIHHTVTLRGGVIPSDQEVEARATELALKNTKDRDLSRFKTLLVAPDHLEPHKAYKVHPKKRELVEVKRKGTRKSAKRGTR